MTPHGTPNRYGHYGCRCAECINSHRIRHKEWRAKVADLPVPEYAPHGSVSTYNNYGCRCDECRAAQSAKNRSYREARKATS